MSSLRVVFNSLFKVNLVSILRSGYYVLIEVVRILKGPHNTSCNQRILTVFST